MKKFALAVVLVSALFSTAQAVDESDGFFDSEFSYDYVVDYGVEDMAHLYSEADPFDLDE